MHEKAATGQTVSHAQMILPVAALSIRAAVSFCLSETYDDPEHRVKARRQLGECRRAYFTFS